MSGFPGKKIAEARGDAEIAEMFRAMQRAQERSVRNRLIFAACPMVIAIISAVLAFLNALHPSTLLLMIILAGVAISIALSAIVILVNFLAYERTVAQEHRRHEQRLSEIYEKRAYNVLCPQPSGQSRVLKNMVRSRCTTRGWFCVLPYMTLAMSKN